MKIDPTATQLTREQMRALLDARCPTMSPDSREACLTGSVLELADGKKFQGPMLEHSRPTHTAVLPVRPARHGDPRSCN